MVMIGGWCKWQGSRDVWFCLILNHWLYFLFVSTEWFDPPQTLGVSNMAGKVSTWTSFVSSQLRLLWVNNIWRPQQPYMMVRMGNHTKNDLGMGIWTAFFFTTHQISLPKTAKWIDLFLSFLTISGKGLSNSQNKKKKLTNIRIPWLVSQLIPGELNSVQNRFIIGDYTIHYMGDWT